MTIWAQIHGLLLGIPLIMLTLICIANMSNMGEAWKTHWQSPTLHNTTWALLLAFAWATPLSGMWVMYAHPNIWRAGHEWISWGLPWMASWGMMVPILVTTCIYINNKLRADTPSHETAPTTQNIRKSFMITTAIIVLFVALLGALSGRGIFYP